MTESRNVGERPGLGLESRIRECCGVGCLAGIDTGRLQGDLAGGFYSFGFHVSRVVGAYSPCRDRAVVFSPGIGRFAPIMRVDTNDDVLSGHDQTIAAATVLCEGAAACQEDILGVLRVASCVVRQNGNGFALRSQKRIAKEHAGGQAIEPGHVIILASRARQCYVGSRRNGITETALIVGLRSRIIQIIAVLQDTLSTGGPAVEVLGARPFPGCRRENAVLEHECAAGIAHETAAQGRSRAQEAAVHDTTAEVQLAACCGEGNKAAMGAVTIEIGVDRYADTAVVEAADPEGAGQQARGKFLRGCDVTVDVKVPEGSVVCILEGCAACRRIRRVEGQGVSAAVIDAHKGIAACADHILFIDRKVRSLPEAHACGGIAAVDVVPHLLPIRAGVDQIGRIRRTCSGEVWFNAGRRIIQILQHRDRPGPGAVSPVDPHLIVAVPVGKPAFVRGLAQGIGTESTFREQIGSGLFIGFRCIGALEEGWCRKRSGSGNCIAVGVHKAHVRPGQTGSSGDGACAQDIVEPVNSHGALCAVVGKVSRLDSIGTVGGEGVVKVPKAVVQLDQGRGRHLGQRLTGKGHALDACAVHNVAGHGDAFSREDRGCLRVATVPEDLRRVGIGLGDGAAGVGGGVAVEHRTGFGGDADGVGPAIGVFKADLSRQSGGLAFRQVGVAEGLGGEPGQIRADGNLTHVVDGHSVRHSLEADPGIVLVGDGQVVVHGNLPHAAADPAGGGGPIPEQPARVVRNGGVQFRERVVRVVEGEGFVVTVDVDALGHRTDPVGNGRDGIGRSVSEPQDTRGDLMGLQHSLCLGVGGCHDHTPFGVVVAHAHAGLPALGTVADLLQLQIRVGTGGLEADGQGQGGAQGRADVARHVEDCGVLQDNLVAVIVGVILVVVRGIQAVVVVGAVQIGIGLGPQVQTAEFLHGDEAGDGNRQGALNHPVIAGGDLHDRAVDILQLVNAVLVILGHTCPLLWQHSDKAAVCDIHRFVDG